MAKRKQHSDLLGALTKRELEILFLLHDGLSNAKIAERLVLTIDTVKWYTKQIYSKLGVGSRTEALARARALGLLAGEMGVEALNVSSFEPKNNLPLQVSSFIGREED